MKLNAGTPVWYVTEALGVAPGSIGRATTEDVYTTEAEAKAVAAAALRARATALEAEAADARDRAGEFETP